MTLKSKVFATAAFLAVGSTTPASADRDAGIYALSRLGITAMASFLAISEQDIPEDINERVLSQRTGVHAIYRMRSGEEDFIGSGRSPRTALGNIPPIFISALLATEDSRFFEHPGLDPIGTARATVEHLYGRSRGASGITQQLIKNQIVGSEVSLRRKAIEAALAIELEGTFSKDEILQAYLGAVWFGRGWGAAGAAQSWFGRNWDDLSLSEIAFLAGILQGPALLNPQRHPERAQARKNHVLQRMLDMKGISSSQFEAAKAEKLVVIETPVVPQTKSWAGVSLEGWVESTPAIASLLEPAIDARDTSVIETTFDQEWIDLAQNSLRDQINRLGRIEALGKTSEDVLSIVETAAREEGQVPRHIWTSLTGNLGSDIRVWPGVVLNQTGEVAVPRGWGNQNTWRVVPSTIPQGLSRGDIVLVSREEGQIVTSRRIEGAVVVMNIHTGDVLASIGGSDIRLSQFDRTTAQRQPGSSMKAFVYLAAMEMGWRPQDLIDDTPTSFSDGYRPRNYGGAENGIIPFYTAFEISSNIAAVKIANEVGIMAVSDVAQRAGAYDRPIDPYLPSALGATVTSLRNLVSGYATIGNGGWPVRANFVRHITDRDGNRWDITLSSSQRVFGDWPIEDMLSMMRGVIVRGTASNAFRDHPVSIIGKTGTSQDNRDAVFVGMGADIAVGVWIGRDDNQPTAGFLGGTHAAPVAARIFRDAFERNLITSEGHEVAQNSGRLWPPLVVGRSGQQRQQPVSNGFASPPATASQRTTEEPGGFFSERR